MCISRNCYGQFFIFTVSKCEIEAQLQNFRKLTNQKSKMERLTFRDVLHNSFGITEDLFMDRGTEIVLTYKYMQAISIYLLFRGKKITCP